MQTKTKRKTDKLTSTANIAAELGVVHSTVTYWRVTGRIPAPTIKRGLRYFYTDKQAKQIIEQMRNTS